MPEFIKGLELCESFFHEVAKPIIHRNFPKLQYTAGLLGYGSDVLGYDDTVSADHMWGPRFYMFLSEGDIGLRHKLMESFQRELPFQYKGYSVNFSEPNPDDGGVRHPKYITEGKVYPLIWIYTINDFVHEYIGIKPKTNTDWLALSEHRLLGFTSGKLFVDMLNLSALRKELFFYPSDVKLYLIASQWDLIAEEQAFVKRCSDCGDEIGSRIICIRIAERLMRLCFLYHNQYAPYSKWFGTAFSNMQINGKIKNELHMAIKSNIILEREKHIVTAQALVAEMHNEFKITEYIPVKVEKYFNRNIDVIYTDRIASITKEKITDEDLNVLPLFGTLSQIGNFVALSDNPEYNSVIKGLYLRAKEDNEFKM